MGKRGRVRREPVKAESLLAGLLGGTGRGDKESWKRKGNTISVASTQGC